MKILLWHQVEPQICVCAGISALTTNLVFYSLKASQFSRPSCSHWQFASFRNKWKCWGNSIATAGLGFSPYRRRRISALLWLFLPKQYQVFLAAGDEELPAAWKHHDKNRKQRQGLSSSSELRGIHTVSLRKHYGMAKKRLQRHITALIRLCAASRAGWGASDARRCAGVPRTSLHGG